MGHEVVGREFGGVEGTVEVYGDDVEVGLLWGVRGTVECEDIVCVYDTGVGDYEVDLAGGGYGGGLAEEADLVVPVCYVAVYEATVFQFGGKLLSAVDIAVSETHLYACVDQCSDICFPKTTAACR